MKKYLTLLITLTYALSYAQTNKVKAEDKLTLIFTGDFMGHKDQINAAYDKSSKTYKYDECFKYIKPFLSDADFTIGNLEVTLGVKPYSGYPQFSSPASYASAIKNAGVDVLVTANNHSCDKYKKGIEKTIHILDSLDIKHGGTYVSLEEKNKQGVIIIEKKGFKIAILNFTYGTNGLKPQAPNIINYLNKETIEQEVKIAQKAKVDEIIAFVHWGYEYKNLPNKEQKYLTKVFKDNGVNLIVGAHPHVLQPMEYHKDNFVAYSLGNFVSHQRTHPRDGGAILKLSLVKEQGKVKLKNAEYKLTWVYEPIVNGKKQYYVLPVSQYETYPQFFKLKKDYDKMKRFSKHARELLGKHNINVKEYN